MPGTWARSLETNRIFAVSAFKLAGMVSGICGWTPDQFWNATPTELATIFAAFADNGPGQIGQMPLGADQLAKLKEIFPDAK